MDIYYGLASVMFSITVILATAYLIVWFMRPFLNNGRYAWEAGAVYFVVMLIIYCIPYEVLGMFRMWLRFWQCLRSYMCGKKVTNVVKKYFCL